MSSEKCERRKQGTEEITLISMRGNKQREFTYYSNPNGAIKKIISNVRFSYEMHDLRK